MLEDLRRAARTAVTGTPIEWSADKTDRYVLAVMVRNARFKGGTVIKKGTLVLADPVVNTEDGTRTIHHNGRSYGCWIKDVTNVY